MRTLLLLFQIPDNLPSRYHWIPREVSLPRVPSKGRSPRHGPAVPQERSNQALREQFIHPSSGASVATTQWHHVAVAGQTQGLQLLRKLGPGMRRGQSPDQSTATRSGSSPHNILHQPFPVFAWDQYKPTHRQ